MRSLRTLRLPIDESDGPMLDVLKGFEGSRIDVPRRQEWRPDRDALARRFERFTAAA